MSASFSEHFSLYRLVVDPARQTVSEHRLEFIPEVAVFRKSSQICNEFVHRLPRSPDSGVESEALHDFHRFWAVVISQLLDQLFKGLVFRLLWLEQVSQQLVGCRSHKRQGRRASLVLRFSYDAVCLEVLFHSLDVFLYALGLWIGVLDMLPSSVAI